MDKTINEIEERLMSRADVASYMGVSERSITNYEERGLTAVRIGSRTMFRRDDVDEFIRRRQSYRIDPKLDLSQFEVDHVERRQTESGRRPTHSFLLMPTTTNCNDKPLSLSEAQFDMLTKLANLSQNVSWRGDDLGKAQTRSLLKELDWLAQVIALLRQSRGLTVQRHKGD